MNPMTRAMALANLVGMWLLLSFPATTTCFVVQHSPEVLHHRKLQTRLTQCWLASGENNDDNDVTISDDGSLAEAPLEETAELDPKVVAWKNELIELSRKTQNGFRATSSERKKARDIIFDLARFNPTKEPASPYYSSSSSSSSSNHGNTGPSLAGKWNLIFTDAPDITSLDTSRNPFSTAKLGRIGQECQPPYIKNIIEWRRPDWAKNLPLSGSDDSRVLQKVVTSASASPDKPLLVDLKVAGLELEAGASTSGKAAGRDDDFAKTIETKGIPAGLLSQNPIDLKGPLNPPFGQFEILYLDDELRIIKTGQNYVAANLRVKEGEEWF